MTLYNLTPCLFRGILVPCRPKLSSRNQGFNRAPGSWKSHFGIGSRSENSMNGMTPPLNAFPLAFQPVNDASCRPLSPQPKPGVFASHVVAAVLTTVVADHSEARNQSPEAVAKMALASDVVVVQVSRQLPKPRCRSPSTEPRKVAQYLTRERQQQSAKETQQQSQLEN